ncbi:MAG: tetraacyldisaccharide 4'-kinase [Gemmatimonadales bacterium]|nr:tetraacyldisaccharide 4'-kinase [Gemmatimonadales bacterium]
MDARARRAGRRLLRWLWTSRRPDARVVRTVLLPASALWRLGTGARDAAHRAGWLGRTTLPLPVVVIGNLTVGRSGSLPVSHAVAARLAARGTRVALHLGTDATAAEVAQAREALDGVRVASGGAPSEAAARAVARQADVLLLDDAFPAPGLVADATLLVVSAESSAAVPWAPPAGPWRESWRAAVAADVLVVTRKRASAADAEAYAEALAARTGRPVARAFLGVLEVQGLRGGVRLPAEALAGKRVIAAGAARDPEGVVAATKAMGAAVQPAPWRDARAGPDDLAWLVRAARKADHVVVGPRDADLVRRHWPEDLPEPLVAVPGLHWEAGEAHVHAAVDAALLPPDRL